MQKRKIKTLALLLAIPLFLKADFIDLGIRGPLYEIQEKSFAEEIAERTAGLDYKYWEEQLLESANESLIIKSNIPNCEENKSYQYDPSFIIEEDIIIPYTNQVVHKKGYKYNPLTENNITFSRYQIFIDADDFHQLSLAMNYANKADIFVVKGDYKNLLEYDIEGYAYREQLDKKAFKINCLPTIYAQKDDLFNVREYKLNDSISKDKSDNTKESEAIKENSDE